MKKKYVYLYIKNHEKIAKISKSTGISMAKLVNGIVAALEPREILKKFYESALATFKKGNPDELIF